MTNVTARTRTRASQQNIINEQDNDEDDDDTDIEQGILMPSISYGAVDDYVYVESGVDFEIAEQIKENQSKNSWVYFIDCILSAFLFAPISALYWYGTWSLMDTYILPNNIVLSSIACYLTGLIVLMPGYVFQESLQEFYDRSNSVTQFFIRRIHVYVVSLAYAFEWRGCWTLCDKYILLNWKGDLSLALVSLAYLLIARSFRFVTSSPFLLSNDSTEYYFLSRSRYKVRALRSTYAQYAFDFLVAELVESFVSIIAWRDIAAVFDQYLYPNNFMLNTIVSAVIGYGIYFVLALTQFYTYKRTSHYTLIPRLIFEDLYNLFMFISVIILWRIYWTVPAQYIYIEKYQLEIYLATHFGSYILATLFQASCVVTGFGYDYKDGELNTNGNYFLLSYLTDIYTKTPITATYA